MHRNTNGTVALLCALHVSAAGAMAQAGTATFAAPIERTLPTGYPRATAGDWNGDGAVDLAFGGTWGTTGARAGLSVVLNDGNGNFGAAASTLTEDVGDIGHGDVDGDGHLDLITVIPRARRLRAYLGDGSGSFALGSPTEFTLSTNCSRLAVADLDRDGIDDVVAADGFGAALLARGGPGASLFATITSAGPTFGGSTTAPEIVIGDANDDGTPDIIQVHLGTFYSRANDGSGGFAAPVAIAVGHTGIARLAVADFDGDGRDDIAGAAVGFSTGTPAPMVVLINAGRGSFIPQRYDAPTQWAQDIAPGDLDGDGDLDLIVAIQRVGGANLWFNDGRGCFDPLGCTGSGLAGGVVPMTISTPTAEGFAVVAADFDRDSRTDLVFGLYRGGGPEGFAHHRNITPRRGNYPGTAEDFELLSAVHGPSAAPLFSGGPLHDVKNGAAGELLTLHVHSPQGTFDYAPLLLLASPTLTATGLPAPTIPGFALDPGFLIPLANGTGSPFSGALVLPGGWRWAMPVPAGLSGVSLFFQTLALPGAAPASLGLPAPANGVFAATDAHEIRL